MTEALRTGADLWVFGVTLVIWLGLSLYLLRLKSLLGAARGWTPAATAALGVLVVLYLALGSRLPEAGGLALVVGLNLLLWTRIFDLLLDTHERLREAEAKEEMP